MVSLLASRPERCVLNAAVLRITGPIRFQKMVTVRYIITAPFRAVWFVITLPFLIILWVLALLKRGVLAIVRYVCGPVCVLLAAPFVRIYVLRYYINLGHLNLCIFEIYM